MEHQEVMAFLTAALGKLRIRLVMLSPQDRLEQVDNGLRALLGLWGEYETLRQAFFRTVRSRTVYRLMDAFGCGYVFFALPEEQRTVVIGPYLTEAVTEEELLETVETLGLPLQYARSLTEFYAPLPVLTDTSTLMALITTMEETLWGGVEAFETIDLNRDGALPLAMELPNSLTEAEQLAVQMKTMQTRYDAENQMMEAVSKGLLHRVEQIAAHISELSFEKRMADPLRNTKNYCIICNTLLRKAAEQGGVHPVHVDRVSSRYAVQIENNATTEGCIRLIGEMFRTYCRLVRSHAISQYCAPVQKAIIYMEENLSGDLGLQTLAEALQLTPGYLSALFHREVGQTITQYITELRMKQALHLLKTTRLQVQNVAQLCGVSDANYFTKLFRSWYGVTPRRYRQSLVRAGGSGGEQ